MRGPGRNRMIYKMCVLLAVAPGIAAADTFATASESGAVEIHRVTGGKLDRVYAGKEPAVSDFGWSDARTLWIVSHDDTTVTAAKLVDATRTATKVQADITQHPAHSLHVTKAGEVHLQHCLQSSDEGYGGCTQWGYTRLDRAGSASQARPKDILDHRVVAALPASKTPAGYAAKVAKHRVTCTGPGKRVEWPAPDDEREGFDTLKVKSTTWIRTTPPVLRIAYRTDTMGGPVDDTAFVRDCTDIGQARAIGGAVWAWRSDGSES